MPAVRTYLPTLLTILAVALVVRLLAWGGIEWLLLHHWQREFVIPGDADGYWHLAGDLASGREFAIYDPPRRVLRMPGFPALLACFQLIGGERLWFARLCLSLVGVICCWLVYKVGSELYDEQVGRWGALGTAVSPALVGSSPLVLSETTFAATLLLSLWCGVKLVRSLQKRTPALQDWAGWSIACGLACAAACYVRPSWLPAAPGLALLLAWLIAPRSRSLLAGGLLVLVLLLALVPWGLRNQRVTGHFVLTTLWMGPSLYDGLHPGATGDSDMTFYDRDNLLGRGLSEYEVDQHYRREAWGFVRSHPGQALRLALQKLWRFWSPWPNAEQFHQLLVRGVIAAGSLITFALAVRGLSSPRTREDPWRIILPVGPIVFFSLLHLVFVGSLRYRLPAEYALWILSAEGLQRCFRPVEGEQLVSMPELSSVEPPPVSPAGDSGSASASLSP